MSTKRLRIYNFNNMENAVSDAIEFHDEFFCDDQNGTAHKKIGDYLSLQRVELYLGHDGVVYPHFEVTTVNIR